MIIFYIISVFLALISFLYCLDFALGIFVKKKNPYPAEKPVVRFASLVAARNEENVIADVVRSLKTQNYPEELNDIYVLINNTTDNTESKAKIAGAKVIKCPPEIKNKGDALQFAFTEFEGKYDAYCIFDADNIVDPDFLQKMNDCYISGSHVAQGYRNSRNPSSSFSAFCMTLFFSVINHMYNEGHRRLGMTASLNGTGLMIGADVIKKTGYSPVTMVEDMEFTAICAINGIKIAWVENAIVKDEQPDNFRDSVRQRRRWNYGQYQCWKKYSGDLLKRKSLQSYETWLYLSGATVMAISSLMMSASFIFLFYFLYISHSGWRTIVFPVLGAYILYLLFCHIILTVRKSFLGLPYEHFNLVYILFSPVFFLTWNFVALSALIHPPKYHEYIPHQGNMTGSKENGRLSNQK